MNVRPAQPFRLSRYAHLALGSSLLLASTTITLPASADLLGTVAPARNFDMSHWKLTLPVNSSGSSSGSAAEISSATLTGGSGYQSSWFRTQSDGGLVFTAPVKGATTSGSSYPRSELREQMVTGSDRSNWTSASEAVMDARLVINNVPKSTGKIVIGQIHGYDAAPLVKLRYFRNSSGVGRLDALVKATPSSSSDVSYPLSTNLPLGSNFTYNITVSDGVLSMSVNGATPKRHVIDASWAGIGLYFKAGVYTQASGSSTSDIGRTTFYRLAISHPENDLAVTTTSLPAGEAGGSYTQVLDSTAGAGSRSWSLASGRLPEGLSLQESTGIISGTLPSSVSSSRDPSFVVLVNDTSGASAAQLLNLTITP
jgi:hypothetical protein